MKRILTLALIAITTLSYAQPQKETREEREERIKAHKIAFISTELNLTTKEAEKFWPVYNELEGKMESVHKEKRGHLKKLKNFEELSEDEAYSLIEKIFALDLKEANLRSEYLSKFAAAVGKKKAAKVYVAEEKFKRELLRKLKKNNENNGGGGGRGGPGRNGPQRNR